MPKCVERDWPLQKPLAESTILELLPNLSPDVPVAVVFEFSKCQMVINKTVELLDIDHYVSYTHNRCIKWQILDKNLKLEQIQNVTNCLVVKVWA